MDKIKKFLKHKVFLLITCFVVLVLTVGLIIGNVVSLTNFHVVTAFMCGTGLDDDSDAAKEARSSSNALAAKVAEEGAVLLKNDNNVLPLKSKTVNVFGVSGNNKGFIPQGTGSGTGSRNDMLTFLGGIDQATADAKQDKIDGKITEDYSLEYNEDLAAAYDKLGYNHIDGGYVIEAIGEDAYKSHYGISEAPESFYTSALMANAKNYSDTAIVVIGRILGEGNDYSKTQYNKNEANDLTRKLQELSAREEFMLDTVCTNFEKVVVVFNTSNIMQAGFLDEYDVDGAIFMGMPGTRGTLGVANLLMGRANPSGKSSDTWAYDLASAASYATSGREGVGSYADISGDLTLGTRANKYSDYLEDIYIGYKWYETADVEKYWDDQGGYDKVVQYPFGYGLSYTNFEWTIEDKSINITNDTLVKDGKISFEVKVKNIGTVAGKDVVQLYYSTPYTKNGIEKSALTLGAFAKTALLKPNEYETIKIEMNVEDMKSYDVYDKNNNGFMGYELEAGNYTISFRTDSHTLVKPLLGKNTHTYKVPTGGFKYEVDTVTNTEVKNQFTTFTATSGATSVINEPVANNARSIDGSQEPTKINYMTRADFKGTFPKDKPANRNAGKELIDGAHTILVNPNNNATDVAPASNSKTTKWVIQDLFGVDYDDPQWDELVSQLSLETKAQLIAKGGFGTIEIKSINKPTTADSDGPVGFNNAVIGQNNLKAVCYPSNTVLAQTWDWFMAYQVGLAIGLEANALGIQGWYGPGANLHRSPTGGRNFEYYSEDPRLSGIMCAYEVLGAKEKGLTAYIKHFAVHDSESGRNGAYKWLTEQNMRENYLLPFEIAVKVGGSNAMMSSVDRVGSTRVSGSYALLTSVLRNEWGFNGTVITDYYQTVGTTNKGETVHDVDECVRAGNSQLLFKDKDPGLSWFNDRTSGTAQLSIHKSAKDILFAYADTLNFSETTQGLEKGNSIGTSIYVFPWWVILLVGIDVTAAGLMGFWIFMAVRSMKKKMASTTATAGADDSQTLNKDE